MLKDSTLLLEAGYVHKPVPWMGWQVAPLGHCRWLELGEQTIAQLVGVELPEVSRMHCPSPAILPASGQDLEAEHEGEQKSPSMPWMVTLCSDEWQEPLMAGSS